MRTLLCLVLLLFGCSPTAYLHGVPNLAQVEAGIWRSGQPTTVEQWKYLYSIGVRHVVKLNFASEGSDDPAASVGMIVHTLSIEPNGDTDLFDAISGTFIRPDEGLLEQAERILEQGGGVLVHCTKGQDRTGVVVGRYRVTFDHWTKEAAYSEMLAHNFHPLLHGLSESWEHFTP